MKSENPHKNLAIFFFFFHKPLHMENHAMDANENDNKKKEIDTIENLITILTFIGSLKQKRKRNSDNNPAI